MSWCVHVGSVCVYVRPNIYLCAQVAGHVVGAGETCSPISSRAGRSRRITLVKSNMTARGCCCCWPLMLHHDLRGSNTRSQLQPSWIPLPLVRPSVQLPHAKAKQLAPPRRRRESAGPKFNMEKLCSAAATGNRQCALQHGTRDFHHCRLGRDVDFAHLCAHAPSP